MVRLRHLWPIPWHRCPIGLDNARIICSAGCCTPCLWRRFFGQLRHGKFKPTIYYNDAMKLTEMVLKDRPTVWQPFGVSEHFLDLGFDMETGELIAIKVWADVRTRDAADKYPFFEVIKKP